MQLLNSLFPTLLIHLKPVKLNPQREFSPMLFWPNIAVKDTRRMRAFVNLVYFFGFAGFVILCQLACLLSLRLTRPDGLLW